MVLLPCGNCCGLCPTSDSDGSGTYFEDYFAYDSTESFQASGWSYSAIAGTGPSFLNPGTFLLGNAGSVIERCTGVDLSRDFTIEMQLDAETRLTNPALEVATTFRNRFAQFFIYGDAPGGTAYTYFNDSGRPLVFSGYSSQGSASYTTYKMVLSFVSGLWSVSSYVNGSLAWSGSCPSFYLVDNRFFHRVLAGQRSVTISRYYMKLTYL
jgi:hypothetical protein